MSVTSKVSLNFQFQLITLFNYAEPARHLDFAGTRRDNFRSCIIEHADVAFLAFSRYSEVDQY